MSEFSVYSWIQACRDINDISKSPFGYYEQDSVTPTSIADYQLCLKDAEAGNERARRYMAKYFELRIGR